MATATGGFYSELRYGSWGETAYISGTVPTDFHFTGQREEAGIGLYDYGARWYDTTIRRWMQADTLVPGAGNPQALNRYSYALNGPTKYTDPSGHCPICGALMFGAVALGTAYLTGRVGYEVVTELTPGMFNASTDMLGGALVTNISEVITVQAARNSVDPSLVAAVLRHESGAIERRTLTLVPMTQPGAMADLAETIEANVRTNGTASIGPAQMQVRRAEMLEALGYVTPRGGRAETIRALLGKDTSVEYVVGMLHYMSDQLNTLPGFGDLSKENQQRLILIGYNQGWTDQFLENIRTLGFEKFIQEAKYDNLTLDEYLRWLHENGGQ